MDSASVNGHAAEPRTGWGGGGAGLLAETVLWMLVVSGGIFRVVNVTHYNPIDAIWSDPGRHWEFGTKPLESSPMPLIDPIGFQTWLALIAKMTLGHPALTAAYAASLSVLTPCVWFLFLRELLHSPRLALLGWAILMWLPSWIGIYSYFMTETLVIPLIGLAMHATWRSARRDDAGSFLWMTGWWTLAVLTRPAVVPLAGVGALWAWMSGGSQVRRAMWACALIGLVVAGAGSRMYLHTGSFDPLGQSGLNRVYALSGKREIQIRFEREGQPVYGYGFGSPSVGEKPLRPWSDWMTSREGVVEAVIDYDRQGASWREAVARVRAEGPSWLPLAAENVVYLFFGQSWPDCNEERWIERWNIESRWMWAPLWLSSVCAMGWLMKFGLGRRWEATCLMGMLLGWFVLQGLMPLAVNEGRYRKPIEGIVIAALLLALDTWRRRRSEAGTNLRREEPSVAQPSTWADWGPSPRWGGAAVLLMVLIWMGTGGFLGAAEIDLRVGQTSAGTQVRVTVWNDSAEAVTIQAVDVGLAGRQYRKDVRAPIRGRGSSEFEFTVGMPDRSGTYVQTVVVTYQNEGYDFSLTTLGLYHHRAERRLSKRGAFREASVRGEGTVVFDAEDAARWRILLPPELQITSDTTEGSTRRVGVRSDRSGFQNSYPIFAVYEAEEGGVHGSAVVEGRLEMNFSAGYRRGWMPAGALLGFMVAAGAALLWVLSDRRRELSPAKAALGKYAARVVFLSAGFLILKEGDHWADQASRLWAAGGWFTWMRDHLRSSNYEYFFRYFVDLYYVACLALSYPYLRRWDEDRPLREDKYVAALRSVRWGKRSAADGKRELGLSKGQLGWLTLAVKIFYIPYLSSWVINNTFHQIHLTRGFEWTVAYWNMYLVALFIYIDTSIFAFGYAVEAKFLNNRIRSVEPTLLGWAVCLWCYPPFNQFSFRPFDHAWFPIHVSAHEHVQTAMLCLITAGWGIFAWASVALGFRASNLTNRGIVSHGPYRYCRHPAYAVKVMIWVIEGVIFGRYFVGLLVGFALIYFMRAWTEERHLERDPDYVAYRKKVRWMFVPGVV